MGFYSSKLISNNCHAFFTKHHGIQKADILSLKKSELNNISFSSNKNLEYISNYFGVKANDLIFLTQTHSNKCFTLDREKIYKKRDSIPTILNGDSVVSNIKGKVLCVITADCVPILLLDKKTNIAGAVHSGWKGALNRIVENTLDVFENLGSNRKDIVASIGPAISQSVYEVQSDFVSEFRKQNPSHTQFFKFGENTTFNLPGFVLSKLKNLGIENIEELSKCTFINKEKFFSYRRSTIQGNIENGRQISAIKV